MKSYQMGSIMKKRFVVTYDTVTEESAAYADIAEHGFVFPDGDLIEVQEAQAKLGQNWRDQWPPQFAHMTLAQAICIVGLCEDGGRAFYECDGRFDYGTGERQSRTLHVPNNITPASYARVRRVFCGQ